MRKLIPAIIAALFLLSVPTDIFAETSSPYTFNMGTETSWISYKEPGAMKQSGRMQGFIASYKYVEDLMLKIEGRISYGDVDYTSISTGDMNAVDDVIGEFRGLTGYNILNGSATKMIPYIGYGYRYLKDDSQGRITTTGNLGYKREANYYYSPAGIDIVTDLGSGFLLGFCFEYDHFWKGIQRSYLSGAIAGLNDLENKQSKGYGYRTSLKIERQQEFLSFIIEPYLRYWKIEQSESSDVTFAGGIVGFGYEPKNYSTEYGLRVGLLF